MKNDQIVAMLIFVDSIRTNAHQTLTLLKKMGLETYILSGDNEQNTAKVCRVLHLTQHYANLKPLQKLALVEKIQRQIAPQKLAFVGDGVNDLAALQQSDLAIAMGSGAAATVSVADITVINEDLQNIVQILMLVDSTRKMIRLNLIWAFAYNVIAICLAFIGILPAVIGAFLMGLSDVNLIANALFFKMKKQRDLAKHALPCQEH